MDVGGHRGEYVKDWGRQALVRRPMVIRGALQNNAPILSKPKLEDVTKGGRTDRKGVRVYTVGTVAAKHWLYGRLSVDADRAPEERQTHFSDELEPSYFSGLVSETFNPAKNRFENRRGARNEPLDTWVYGFAAAHHPELRLHRLRAADWDAREQYLLGTVGKQPINLPSQPPIPAAVVPIPKPVARPAALKSHFASEDWSSRL